MQEKQALAEAPERCRAELVRTGRPLIDSVRQARSHVVQGEVGERVIGNVRHAGKFRHPGGQSRGVTKAQPTLLKRLAPFFAELDMGSRRRRRGEAHEAGEVHQVR